MKIVGLMSGTSADGIDGALIEISGQDGDLTWELLGFEETPFPDSVRAQILRACEIETSRVDDICALDAALGVWFADAALSVCKKAGVSPTDVQAIGSHGQTIHHLPNPTLMADQMVRATLQIGNPAVIAHRTGITTVSDFRSRDMAAGGQGAPLVPLVDYLLFRSETKGRVLLNIGGIANMTVLPAQCAKQDVFAFDTGPGNMVMDGVVAVVTQGQMGYDKDGTLALQGVANESFVAQLMEMPFFKVAPPKSTGRELFGKAVVDHLVNMSDCAEDVVATATQWTAQSILSALRDFVLPECAVDEIIVSGGGAKNPVLMTLISEGFEGHVYTSDALGLSSDAKEAVAFAILAYETLNGRSGNVPRVTGANEPAILGSVTPGRHFFKI